MDKIKAAEDLIKGISIPSQMDIVIAINEEIGKRDCNLSRVSDLISQDVAITAKVLKIANSPFFSARQVETVEHALNLIGITNFTNVIISSALREVMESCCYADDLFWSHSMFTGKTASYIAKKTNVLPETQAYLIGLFHDCAIPILLKRFPEYIQLINHALGYGAEVLAKEDDLISTDHCTLAAMLIKSWKLPEVVYTTIGAHHDDMVYTKNTMVKKAMAVLLLGEYIAIAYTLEGFKVNGSHNWGARYEDTLAELMLDSNDVQDMLEDSFEMLNKINLFVKGSKR